MTPAAVQRALDRVPRASLCHLPTPLQPLPRLSQALGGPRLWLKRDDLTGLAFGGNKSRYLEFTLAEALAAGADAVVLSAVVQSNHCRQFAAAAARLGLQAVVVLRSNATPMGRTRPATGNLLLDHLFGARVCYAAPGQVADAIAAQMAQLRAEGRRPFTGLSPVLSRLGYVQCALELCAQCDAAGLQPAAICVASGANSLAGLVAGYELLGRDVPFIGVPQWLVPDPVAAAAQVAAMAAEAAQRLGLACAPDPGHICLDDATLGAGFGTLDAEARQAVLLLARCEGLLVDPAYTGKALAGLARLARQGRFGPDDDVVFVHTGGTPLVFTYAAELLADD